jgi:hypothetical protein
MRLRTLAASVVSAAVALQGAPALACAAFPYEDAVAEARFRGADGRWRPLHIEVSGPLMRLEYDSTRSASGRVGIVFDVESDKALVFPAPGPFKAPQQARIAIPTTLAAALSGPGLPEALVGRYPARPYPLTAPRKEGRFTCRDAIRMPYSSDNRVDRSVCVIDLGEKRGVGLPAQAVDGGGRRTFELVSVAYRRVPLERFHAPVGFQVASPALKRRTTCGG